MAALEKPLHSGPCLLMRAFNCSVFLVAVDRCCHLLKAFVKGCFGVLDCGHVKVAARFGVGFAAHQHPNIPAISLWEYSFDDAAANSFRNEFERREAVSSRVLVIEGIELISFEN